MTSRLIALALAGLLAAAPAHAADAPRAARDTLDRVVPLPGITVSTARAGTLAPVARTTVERAELKDLNWGQDTPMALQALPGVYAYSDAGNGIGYSYLSIRGFPQRRISVLINGVPLNDPESHEVYWIDHPDLLASTAEAQVQRGVGSALYGAASLGGSVNLETSPFSDTPRSAITTAIGSWGTKHVMGETNSGALPGGWNFYGRYSRIESDGYRQLSDTELWSYAFAARRRVGDQSFRVNLYGGPEETHLAYVGIPGAYLDGDVPEGVPGLAPGDRLLDRRYNPLTYPNERDHFFEPHYELLHDWAIRPSVKLSQTLFYFDGQGYYDEQRFHQPLTDYRITPWATSDSTLFARNYYELNDAGFFVRDANGNVIVDSLDVVRRRFIANRHFGWVPRVEWAHDRGTLTVGGEMRWHDGHHTGQVISGSGLPPGTPADLPYYDYHPRTFAGGLFAREAWDALPRLQVTADLAWRHEEYHQRDDRFDGFRFDQTYDFLSPRLGLTWTPRADVTVFGAWAYSSREPAFQDLWAAEGGTPPLFARYDAATGVWSDPLIGPEHVNDWELGGSWRGARASATVNLFRMDFRDELIPYEYLADVNTWVPVNAARSVHQGIEARFKAALPLADRATLALELSPTLSDNHFVRFTDLLDAATAVSRDGNQIPWFPATMVNGSAQLGWRGARLGADVRYVGRQYVDFSQDLANSVAPHTVVDAIGGWGFGVGGTHVDLSLRVLNALNALYATTGYMDYDASGNLVPMFTPGATRGWLAQVALGF